MSQQLFEIQLTEQQQKMADSIKKVSDVALTSAAGDAAIKAAEDAANKMKAELDAAQAAFESEMGTRADSFEAGLTSRQNQVESDFDNLNAQYQAAVAAHTVDSEVQNVRVGADNVTYASAGEAVRTQFTNLKSDLKFATETETIAIEVKDKYLKIISNAIDVEHPQNSSSGYGYVIVPCEVDDVFVVSGVSSNTEPLAWAFTDSEYNILAKATRSTTHTDAIIIAPANSAYLVIHDKSPYRLSYKGYSLASVCDDLTDKMANGLDLAENHYTQIAYPPLELGGIDSDGANVVEADRTRTAGYIEKDAIGYFRVDSHTGALYVARYSYENGTYTYLGTNQRTSSGDFTAWIKGLTGTHLRFVWFSADISKMYDWMVIGYKTKLSEELPPLVERNPMIGYWEQSFSVASSTAHSATEDRLNVDIPQGAIVSIKIDMNIVYHPQIYVVYSDGTDERIYINAASTYLSYNKVFTATKRIVQIGVSIPSSSGDKTYKQTITVGNTMADKFHLVNLTPYYIRKQEGRLCFRAGKARNLVQSIAVFNNQVWEFAEGKAYYNGTEYSLANGHGNNCNWGTELHGDYPYLYCPTWITDEMNIKVFSFDGNVFTLEDTIHISEYSGHLDAYVDEFAGLIYGFVYSSNTTGQLTYIVADLTGSVISSAVLPIKIPVIQGICMHDGVLYVVSGYGNSSYPNYLNIIATNGTLLARYPIYGIGEIEGIDFLDNKMVLASYYYFYIDPVLVPESEYYGYLSQLEAS